MRRPRVRVLAVVASALILAACRADPVAGPSRFSGEPLLNMTLGPAANAVYPTLSGQRITAAPARDTIEFTVDALPPTGMSNTYQIVVADSATGRTLISPARIIRTTRTRRPVTRDSSVTVVTADTSKAVLFSIADTATTVRITIADTNLTRFTHVVLRSAGEGSIPGVVSVGQRTGFLSFRYHTGTTYAVADNVFGSWARHSADRLPFAVQADVVNAAFWGDWVRLSIRGLMRPPAGFRYAAWLVDERTGTATRLGGLLTPVPDDRPLDEADLATGPWLTSTGIVEAQVRGDMKALHIKPEDYTFLTLLVEPYGGAAPPARPGTSYVLSAAIPASVSSRSASPGQGFGSVTP